MDTAAQLASVPQDAAAVAAAAELPSGTQWTIAYGNQRAVLVEIGGGIRTYQVDNADVVYGYGPQQLCDGAAGQILAPWPNRIRDGRYQFAGVTHQLPLTEPDRNNAIHGLVNWDRWRALEVATDRVVLRHDLPARPGYPWPLRLTTTWSLGAEGLRADHVVVNLGAEPCPFGIASHPYLVVPGVTVDELSLRVPGNSRLLLDGRALPIGLAKIAGTDYDFTSPRRIGSARLDVAFCDLDPGDSGITTAEIIAPDGRGVRVWADSEFGWWQIYTGDTLALPLNRKSVAIEPMTCPPDAFRSGRDLIVLEPGCSWLGSWGIGRFAG